MIMGRRKKTGKKDKPRVKAGGSGHGAERKAGGLEKLDGAGKLNGIGHRKGAGNGSGSEESQGEWTLR